VQIEVCLLQKEVTIEGRWKLCLFVLASFPGSFPGFCHILYDMQRKAGEKPGNEAVFMDQMSAMKLGESFLNSCIVI